MSRRSCALRFPYVKLSFFFWRGAGRRAGPGGAPTRAKILPVPVRGAVPRTDPAGRGRHAGASEGPARTGEPCWSEDGLARTDARAGGGDIAKFLFVSAERFQRFQHSDRFLYVVVRRVRPAVSLGGVTEGAVLSSHGPIMLLHVRSEAD